MPKTLTPADAFSAFPQVPVAGDLTTPATDLEAIAQSLLNRSAYLNKRRTPVVTPQMYGAVGDNVADDTVALQAWLDDAGANGYIAYLPAVAARYKITSTLYENTGNIAIVGAGAINSIIQLDAPLVGEDVLVIGANAANSRRAAGYITGIAVGTSVSRGGKGGIVLNAVKHYRVSHCHTFNVDIGFDMRNNCYGSEFMHITSADASVNVGLLLRGSFSANAGSGSDIPVWNAWLGARRASVWIEGGGGGYHFHGGQLMGGAANAAEVDSEASMLIGITYEAVTTVATATTAGGTTMEVVNSNPLPSNGSVVINGKLYPYSGKNVDAITGVHTLTGVEGMSASIAAGSGLHPTNTVNGVYLWGVSFEGTDKRHMVRTFCFIKGLNFYGVNFNSNGANRAINAVKIERAGDYQLGFYGCGVQGTFTGTNPLRLLTHYADNWHIEERGTWGSATFSAVSQNYQKKPMVAYSNHPRSASTYENQLWFGGRALRWNAGVLESNTDPLATTGWTVV